MPRTALLFLLCLLSLGLIAKVNAADDEYVVVTEDSKLYFAGEVVAERVWKALPTNHGWLVVRWSGVTSWLDLETREETAGPRLSRPLDSIRSHAVVTASGNTVVLFYQGLIEIVDPDQNHPPVPLSLVDPRPQNSEAVAAADSDYVYFLDRLPGAIYKYDTYSGYLETPFYLGAAAEHLTLSQADPIAWVVTPSGIKAIDLIKQGEQDLPELGYLKFNSGAYDMVANPISPEVYVLLNDGIHTIRSGLAMPRHRFLQPAQQLHITPNGRHLIASHNHSGYVATIELDQPDAGPYQRWFDTDGRSRLVKAVSNSHAYIATPFALVIMPFSGGPDVEVEGFTSPIRSVHVKVPDDKHKVPGFPN